MTDLEQILVRGELPQFPVTTSMASYIDSKFIEHPPGYYGLVVINVEQHKCLVTWLPAPCSGSSALVQ
jgi:hypothetical protein